MYLNTHLYTRQELSGLSITESPTLRMQAIKLRSAAKNAGVLRFETAELFVFRQPHGCPRRSGTHFRLRAQDRHRYGKMEGIHHSPVLG